MKGRYLQEPLELKFKTNCLSEARENKSDQVVIGLVLHLIGWESGVSFPDQSHREAEKT